MKLVIALVALVLGSLVFHWLSPWWVTPLASNWSTIDTTIDITLYITAVVFVAVNLFMAYAIFRYRHKPERRAHYEPENKKLEWWLTGITSIGVAAMLAPGLVVWADFISTPEEAEEVEVLGMQWQWHFRFPGEDGELGEVDASFFGPDNPFGINPRDEAARDDRLVTTNELHLPRDQPIKLLMRSRDVLHNFAVPQFRVKMDMLPGMVTSAWFTPTQTGKYDVLCMELCGIAHYAMRGHVVVDETADFNTWLESQPTWDDMQSTPPGDPAAGEASYAVCASCHGTRGEGNKAMNGPRLAGLSDWYIQRQMRHFQEGIRGAAEGDQFGQQMAPMSQVLADETALRNVAAYIESLEPPEPEPTVEGNPAKGASRYTSCAACHGAKAQGNYALQAPALAGQSDWYLKRQLKNFREGIRGGHKQDTYGHQMVMMARTLQNEQSINDLLAYLNTL